MNALRSILTAGLVLAILRTTASAITFQVTADTYGTPPVGGVAGVIKRSAGAATTLPITAKSSAFVDFGVGASGINPSTVSGARLVIFFPKVKKPGNLTLFANTTAFTEAFATSTTPSPTPGAAIGGPIAVVVADSKNFATIDVTAQVKSWLTNSGTDFGFGISADSPTSTVNLVIGSKEGSGSGYPAVLELDVNDSGGAVSGANVTFAGNVGIGTTTPSNPLSVAFGATEAFEGSDSAGPSISLELTNKTNDLTSGSAGRSNAVGLGFDGGNGVRDAIVAGTFNKDFLDFYTAGDLTVPKVHIDTNVGIGTITPVSRLDVNGDVQASGQFLAKGGSAALSFRNRNNASEAWQFNADNNGVNLENFGGAGISLSSPLHVSETGFIGLGTSSPATRLEVDGTITSKPNSGNFSLVSDNGSAQLEFGVGSSPNNFGLISNTAGPLEFETGGTFRMTILANGKVGIGVSSPASSSLLKVNGGIKCIGAVDTTSDARFKMNIQPLTGALAQTLRLRGVSYDWNRAKFPDKGFDDRRQLGFIAQEVREILPDIVSQDQDGYLSIGYTAIIPVLAEAVKELKQQKDAEIAALKADAAALKADNAALAQKLAALEARDAARVALDATRGALDAELKARLTRLESALDERPVRAVTAALDLK